ncbi:hypothetical protein F0562_025142 [Nyssa sinensis]|uniref:MPN domain-containing protein n=1 Tax=Nyssa sinensis TaxID=561372 RepID=A0A5J5BJD4_9ASTE|nr:hypothetical protein F0562_025142 [Nyssa sinensis]
MSSSSGGINIAASARKHDVDHRISLRYYHRIVDNILKQADIFREEKNIIDLYIMLLRFSSLASETIPYHRDFRASPQSSKNSLKRKLLNALRELEELKPAVQQKTDELNRKHIYQVNEWGHLHQNGSFDSSLEWPPIKKQSSISYGITKTPRPATREFVYQGSRIQEFSHAKPVEEQFRRLSLSIPRPKEETLSRHSILGPNGLRGQWQPPSTDKGVQYPSNIDLTPVEIPRQNSLQQPVKNGVFIEKDTSNSEHEKSITEAEYRMENPSPDGLVCSESPLQLHISTALMDGFMKLAKSNTDKNLETCGVLAGSLKNRKFYVTALIIPKQESTSDSCQTTNEEEIFEVQDKQSLFPLGWIHTHPTQSCFMSSIDLHTHYSYQIMLPEAIAIVMAPRDSSRTHGIFRLTTPGGMTVIRHCPRRGFHPHDPPSDGGPIYKQCTDVFMNSSIKFDVIDLR